MPSFYEFFAGGGMARAGLGDAWQCLIANDIDEKKGASYTENWGGEHLLLADVAGVKTEQLPGQADLAWASFPCQDLSLAGAGAGLRAERSGAFWPFWRLMKGLVREGRGPRLIVLENVYGALRSHEGKDFAAIASAFSGINYRVGAVVIDAADFLPQSRPRLFVVGVRSDVRIPDHLKLSEPSEQWHPQALVDAHQKLTKAAAMKWVWWNLPSPPGRQQDFADLIEDAPEGVKWHTQAETKKILGMMTDLHRDKVKAAQAMGRRVVGGVYRRTRAGVQRTEVRFDDLAGCLRTPSGGSSRQTILLIEGRRIRSRLLSPREAARLMGLPDTYRLPKRYNDAYHLAGDGVAVPVVRFLAEHLFEVLLSEDAAAGAAA